MSMKPSHTSGTAENANASGTENELYVLLLERYVYLTLLAVVTVTAGLLTTPIGRVVFGTVGPVERPPRVNVETGPIVSINVNGHGLTSMTTHRSLHLAIRAAAGMKSNK